MVVDTSAFDGTDCNVLVLSLFRGTREKVREQSIIPKNLTYFKVGGKE